MKNKKKVLIIVAVILFIVGIFIMFKAAVWGVYKSCISDIDNLDEIMKGYKNSSELIVNTKEIDNNIEFADSKIGNYFNEFKKDEEVTTEWSETYYQYDNEEKVGMFSIGSFTSLVDATHKDDVTIYGVGGDENGISFSGLFYSGFSDFIKENNIKDDADLVKAFSKYDFSKEYGVFTSLKKLREDYSIRLIASISLPSIDKICYLKGDLKGYMLEINSFKNNRNYFEINVFKNDKRYIFSVLSSDFDFDDMKEIINTIVID